MKNSTNANMNNSRNHHKFVNMASIMTDHAKTHVNEKTIAQEEIRSPTFVAASDTTQQGKTGLTTRVNNKGVDLNKSYKGKSSTDKNQPNQTIP